MKKLFLLSTLFFMGMSLMAQMSDVQIVAYAKQRQSEGATAQTIGSELMERGVTKEQLQRVYSAYNNATDGGVASSTDDNVDRERHQNGIQAPSVTPESEGRKVFGREVFRTRNLSFEPNMNIAIPQNYHLGPGDELIIDVYGDSQSSAKYKVAPDGTVNIPRVGPVGVSGFTVEAAQRHIANLLGQHYENSSIKLSVGQTRTITVNIMGEVYAPGTYTLSAFASVFHALYVAGGTNSLGTLRDIKVARNGKVVTTVDVYDYILYGRLAGNVSLQDNDVIIVGTYNNLVNISGNVKRPMWYELKKNETLSHLIRYAGDFTGDAYTSNVRVERKSGEKLSVHTVARSEFDGFKLSDDDQVFVSGNENRYLNSVIIQGAVLRPGNYEFEKVHTFRTLIAQAGGLTDDAQTNRAVLIRTKSDLTKEAVTIDIAGILQGTAPDVMLQNEDVITIASKEQMNKERTLSIEGEVYNPGTFPYASGLTIEDFITLAGGLRESASLLNVEVARRIVDPMADNTLPVRCERFTFNLSEGLAVGESNKFELQPYDQVYIRRSPVYAGQRKVHVSGEVMFAGNYVLEEQDTRISEIIKRAGGFKDKASVANARLLRKMDDDELARRQQLIEMSRNSTDSIELTGSELATQYSVGINLVKAMEQPGSSFDILLRDGDQIIVPEHNSTVKISGEILYPNVVTYVDGKDKNYYIEAAGGYTKESLKRRAYIIYANGEVAKLSNGKIEPGCEIVVPQKSHRDNSATTMKWISISSSIVATLAIVANAIK